MDPNLKNEITRSILKINKRFIAHFNRWKEWILNFQEKLGKLQNIDLLWRKKNISFLPNCSKKLKLSQRKGSSLLITSIYLLVHAVSLFLCNILKYKSKSTFSAKSRSTCKSQKPREATRHKTQRKQVAKIQSGSFVVHFFAYGHLKLPQDPFPQNNYLTRTTWSPSTRCYSKNSNCSQRNFSMQMCVTARAVMHVTRVG